MVELEGETASFQRWSRQTMVGQGQVCVCWVGGGREGDCAEGFPLRFPRPPHPAAGLSTPFWNIPSLEAPISASPQGPHSSPAPTPAFSFSSVSVSQCVHLFPSLPLLVSISCPSVLSEPVLFPGLSGFVCASRSPVSLSVVPRKFPEPTGDHPPHLPPTPPLPPTPAPPQVVLPLRRPSLTVGGHAPPAAQSQPPGQRDPAHPGAPRDLCQTFLRSCWACRGGGGRAGLSPALPPAPGSPALALSAGHRKGSSPAPLHSTPRPPSPLPGLLLPPRPPKPFPPPLAPPASTHRAGSRGATGIWRG